MNHRKYAVLLCIKKQSFVWHEVANLFIRDLFKDALSSADCTASKIEWLIKCKVCGRKRSCTDIRHYPEICLDELRKTTKSLIRNFQSPRDEFEPGTSIAQSRSS